MASIGLSSTNVHTVNVEFWEEHEGSLKRSRRKVCLSERPRDNSEYLASNNTVYSLGNEG